MFSAINKTLPSEFGALFSALLRPTRIRVENCVVRGNGVRRKSALSPHSLSYASRQKRRKENEQKPSVRRRVSGGSGKRGQSCEWKYTLPKDGCAKNNCAATHCIAHNDCEITLQRRRYLENANGIVWNNTARAQFPSQS